MHINKILNIVYRSKICSHHVLQQCFLFFIVVVILGHNLGNSQVSVYRTIGPTLVFALLLLYLT